MLVGIRISFQHIYSTIGLLLVGGVNLYSFWRPISAMSLLKSPHSIYVWFGCASICILMVCCMVGINLISSIYEGMYKCIISHGCNG